MYKKFTLVTVFLAAILIYVTLSSSSGGINGVSTSGCTCHGAQNGNTVVTISGLPTNYVVNQVYALTITITNSTVVSSAPNGKRGGFDLTVGSGSFTAGTGTALNGVTEIRHNAAKAFVGNTVSWTFNWTAPSSNVGAVTFNFAGNAANGDGGTAGDQWNLGSVVVAAPPSGPTATATSTTIACNGGVSTITAGATGGTAPYNYRLNAGAFGTSNVFSSNVAGTYTVTVRDVNLATASTVITITQPTVLSNTSSQVNVSCNSGASGSATVVATGGTSPYTYSWAPSGGTAATASGLVANTYTCTITDSRSCTKTQTFTITQPTALATTGIQTNISCNGGSNGSATTVPSGGTAPYTYSWSPSGGTASTASGLVAGNYTCTVTDSKSCQITRSFTITQPAVLTTTISQTNVSCNGGNNGSSTITASGGTTPYTYAWSLSGGTAATANGLLSGIYTCVVTDAKSCTSSKTAAITQPPALTNTFSQNNISCNGGTTGSASVVASGGTPSYTYSWSPSGGTAATATTLAAASYTCTITDANACTRTQVVTLTQPSAISVVPTQNNITCNGANNGSAGVSVSGGIPSYTYSWLPSGGTAASATSLAAATYTCNITDANGCVKAQTFSITQPAVISIVPTQIDVSCNGASNGTASVSVSGGTPTYSYSWVPAGGSGSSAAGLSSGTYTCTVSDVNLCTKTQVITITEPTALGVTATAPSILCNGNTTTITSAASGGNAPYQYALNAGAYSSTSTFANVNAGIYTVSARDANNCTATTAISIGQPQLLQIAVSTQSDSVCVGANNGFANFVTAGGTIPYSYSFAPNTGFFNGPGQSWTNLGANSYLIQVSDANGCTASTNFSIFNYPNLTVTTSVSPASPITGDNVVLQITAPLGASSYAWNGVGGSSTGNILALNNVNSSLSGIYTATVVDVHNCSASSTLNLNITPRAKLLAKCALAGPMLGTGLMNDLLRSNGYLLSSALTEPYSAAPYNTVFTHVNGGGGETTLSGVLAISDSNAIVDWVFIELRSSTDSSLVVATKSALVQKDGDVVSASDGVSGIIFRNTTPGTYFVAVKHRNHLGVMTKSAVNISEAGTVVDFTSLSTLLYRKPAASNENNSFTYSASQDSCTRIIAGKRALYAGNCNLTTSGNAFRFVSYSGVSNDRLPILTLAGSTNTINGYLREDLNLDGQVKYNGAANDRLILLQNIGSNLNLKIYQQTPN